MTVSVAKFIKHLLNNLNVASYLTLIILGDRYCFTVLHVKELWHREVKVLPPGHTASKWQSWV